MLDLQWDVSGKSPLTGIWVSFTPPEGVLLYGQILNHFHGSPMDMMSTCEVDLDKTV